MGDSMMAGADQNSVEQFLNLLAFWSFISDLPGSIMLIVLRSFDVEDTVTKLDMLHESVMFSVRLQIVEHFIVVHEVGQLRLGWEVRVCRHFFRRVDHGRFHHRRF